MTNFKFEHLLLDSRWEISPNLYSKAKYYNFKFGSKYVFTYDQPFPKDFTTSALKKAFINSLRKELEKKRLLRNKRARESYAEKKRKLKPKKKSQRKKRLPQDIEELSEKIIEKDSKYLLQSVNTKPTVSTKSGKGVFFNSKIKELRFVEINFGRELPVNQSSFEDMWDKILYPAFLKLYDKSYSLKKKGTRKFISKIITPYYNIDGELMFDDEIQKYQDGEKTGNKTRARTKYSFGFSTSRTLDGITREEYEFGELARLHEEFSERVLTNKNAYIRSGHVKDIKISGILLEEVMEEH